MSTTTTNKHSPSSPPPLPTNYTRTPLSSLPKLSNDVILRVMRGEPLQPGEHIPVWMMRQAGRYLPEFRAVRAQHDFFEVCRNPQLACEVTIQPLERFGPELLSACIIFSDILVILQAMGIPVTMEPKEGPKILTPLESPFSPLYSTLLTVNVNVEKELGYVFDAINLTRVKLNGRVPLIGFSGAPFTLMAYLIEGGGSRTLSKAKRWLFEYPNESKVLLQKITDVIVEYLIGQVNAGAQALQVFESNGGDLTPRLWDDFSLPYLSQIASRVKASIAQSKIVDSSNGNYVSPPLIVFSRGSNWEGALESLVNQTVYDVISLDWTIDPVMAKSRIDHASGNNIKSNHSNNRVVTIQGNLCPAVLYTSPTTIKKEVTEMLDKFELKTNHGRGLVANLGHGMEPDMDPEHAKAFLEAVRGYM
jgi:uroporphyrinogen decarboxylase